MKTKKMKKQDIPVIGRMLFEAFKRNKVDFESFSSLFGGSFETDMTAAIKAVRDRRRPVDVYDKQKKVTIDLYNKVDEMQEALRLLGEYVIMAEGNLVTLYDNYHIKEARKALRLKNVEGVMEHCEIIVDKVTNDDSVALDAVGFDAGKLAEFELLIVELDDLNTEQNNKIDERQDVKAVEDSLFEELFDYMDKVARVGKAIYTYKEKQRYDEFSVNNLLGRINHGRKKQVADDGSETEIAAVYDVMIGKVTDKTTDEPLENAVVRIEGTSIMVDTDSDGEFYLDEIPAGVYTISFAKTGFVKAEQHNVEIGTETMVELLVELMPE